MKGSIYSCFNYFRRVGAVACKTLNNNKVMQLSAVTILSIPALQASAADLFSGGKSTISDTFGASSTVIWILYVLEIIAAIFTYVKTKNLAMFGGIAAVMVFVNVAFGIIPT